MKLNTKRTIRFFWKHIKNYKFSVLFLILGVIIATVAELVAPYFYKLFLDLLVETSDRSQSFNQLVIIITAICGINLISWAAWRITILFVNIKFQAKVMGNISNECFEVMHNHSYNFFTNNFSGSLVRKINRIVRAFESIMERIYFDLIPIILKITIIFVVLFYIQPILGIVMIVWTILFCLFNLFCIKYRWKFDISKAKADTKTTARLADTITNAVTIKLFAGFKYEISKYAKIIGDWMKKTQDSWRVNEYIQAVQHFAMIVLEFIVFIVVIIYWEKGVLTAGDFIWIQAYILTLFERIWGFGRVIQEFLRDFADAEEMIEIIYKDKEIKDKINAKELAITRGKIDFQKVNFFYDKKVKIINSLTLKIKPGEKIALVGPSGGGKTTVAKLILRFFDIQKGTIKIDDQNITDVTQESLRSKISLVPQDPILFHRSLMENIKYGCRNATKEEVIAASKMAKCHDFIIKLPKGYDTFVGERGIKLSGGERQRVAIARAILANNPILILDEATSSLDSESESLIQQALNNLMKNKTTLIIAHRLSTIMKADRIIVFKDGKIAEEGIHSDLILKESGLYKRLWDLQSGGYLIEN